MKFKIKKRPIHTGYWANPDYISKVVIEFVLYKAEQDNTKECWDYLSSFPTKEAAEDFAKQYKVLVEEREFEV